MFVVREIWKMNMMLLIYMYKYYSYVIVIFVATYVLLVCDGDWSAYEVQFTADVV
jgi:hypothetical protein